VALTNQIKTSSSIVESKAGKSTTTTQTGIGAALSHNETTITAQTTITAHEKNGNNDITATPILVENTTTESEASFLSTSLTHKRYSLETISDDCLLEALSSLQTADTTIENAATSDTAEDNPDYQLDNEIRAIFATSPTNEEEIDYDEDEFLLECIDVLSCDSNTINYYEPGSPEYKQVEDDLLPASEYIHVFDDDEDNNNDDDDNEVEFEIDTKDHFNQHYNDNQNVEEEDVEFEIDTQDYSSKNSDLEEGNGLYIESLEQQLESLALVPPSFATIEEEIGNTIGQHYPPLQPRNTTTPVFLPFQYCLPCADDGASTDFTAASVPLPSISESEPQEQQPSLDAEQKEELKKLYNSSKRKQPLEPPPPQNQQDYNHSDLEDLLSTLTMEDTKATSPQSDGEADSPSYNNNNYAQPDPQSLSPPTYNTMPNTYVPHPYTMQAYQSYQTSFFGNQYPSSEPSSSNLKNERTCIGGHTDTIYGVSFSPCGTYLATAGEDSVVCIWNVLKNKLVDKLKGFSKDYECLRVTWASQSWVRSSILCQNGSHDDKTNRTLVLATAGADGIVKIWSGTSSGHCEDSDEKITWKCLDTVDHAALLNGADNKEGGDSKSNNVKGTDSRDNDKVDSGTKTDGENEEPTVPQIYALQFIDYWSGLGPSTDMNVADSSSSNTSDVARGLLMTSSDDFIHLWELLPCQKQGDNKEEGKTATTKEVNLSIVMKLHFTGLEKGYGGVFVHLADSLVDRLRKTKSNEAEVCSNHMIGRGDNFVFGGDRNPDNLTYVFDASHCSSNDLLGVALSDGTLRLVNGRGVCVSILQLPGCSSHLTSFAWDKSGMRLASCVATGHLILWSIDLGDGKGWVMPSCLAVLEGGHQPGRPLFGAKYCGSENEVSALNFRYRFNEFIAAGTQILLLASSFVHMRYAMHLLHFMA